MNGLSSSVKFIRKPQGYGFHALELFPCKICLARIEALVLLTALLMVVRYILNQFRRRSSSQVLLFLLIMLGTLPYALLDYTIGLMQLTKSNNDVYQVWAVVLVTIRYSIRAVQPSGIFGKQNPLQDMMSSLWTANLLGTKTTLLRIPLWLLWSLNSVRIILGFYDTELTSSRHRKDLRLLTEYMRTEHKHPPLKDCDTKDMKGYKYLVWGEDEQKIRCDPPEYSVQLEVTNEKKIITTNKIWECNGALLGEPKESNELKDLCLAFALFKLLRRRFFGLPFHEANQPKTKELVLKGLIQEKKCDRAFQIIEAELAFLIDYFFTRYAVMFARGFPILRLVLSLSVIGVASYLTVIFYYASDHLAGDLSKTTNGVAVTWILLVILAMKEIWEMVTYVTSDWTKVVLVSNYVQQPMQWWTRYTPIVVSVKFLCKIKIGNRWHGILWQYNLLQSIRYIPWLHYLLYVLYRLVPFNHILDKQPPYYIKIPHIKLLKEVKLAISESLQYLCNNPEALEKYLSTAANFLDQDLEQKIPLASEFPTETQKILVWHIATCYCEIKLANTSQNLDSPDARLQSHYKAATALSQYSAHLLTLQSPLVPDSSLVATKLFRSTVTTTQKSLGSCRSSVEVSQELDKLANDEDKDEKDRGSQKRVRRCSIFCSREERKRRAKSRLIEGKIILKIGVRLGRSLLEEIKTGTKLWKFLEKFWAGYLLYLAASISPDRHKQLLSTGGEFLTHIWALLLHAGVLGKMNQDRPLAVRDLKCSDEGDD